jgi:hypothetical protein
VCRCARAAVSAAAAMAWRDETAVTWVVSMERMAWCRAAVKDSSSAVTGFASLRRRGAGGGRLAAERGGLASADELGGGQPGPGLLQHELRAAGPEHGAGGAVPGAGDRGLVLPERGLRRAPPGEICLLDLAGGHGFMVQEGADEGAGL